VTPDAVYTYLTDDTVDTVKMIKSNDYKWWGAVKSCEYVSSSRSRVSVSAFTAVTTNSPSDLMDAVYTRPVSVGINTIELDFTFADYANGIIT
jgi:hypothetical protein